MSFQMYSSYKDAGFVGLDQVPSHWDVLRFKQVFEEVNERSTTGEEELLSVSEYYGVKPRSQKIDEGEHLSRAESLEGYKLCDEGDLVMNIMLAWKRGLGVTNYRGIVSPAYAVFRLVRDDFPYYYHYLLRSNEYIGYFKTFSSGVIDSRLRLYPEVFGRLTAIVPPLNEQTQIARFLDHETAKIDALIREQERLIALLQEKRQAVISHAATKGLDPSVPMKDSGVEWLGEVPKHWRVVQVRHLLQMIEQGRSPECESRAVVGEEWGVLKTGCVNGGVYRPAEHKTLPAHIPPHSEYEVEEGDLLMSRASGSKDLIGAVAYVEKTPPRLLLSDKVFRLKLEPGVHPKNFTLLMGSRHVRTQIELAINGAEGLANNITKESIKSFIVALPAFEEQKEIFTHLSMQSHRYVQLSEKLLTALNVLKERRSALISAAVTGKIDVRDWQPPTDESPFSPEVREAGMEVTA